jgi:tetratricopeptide (TPR) repeat protein
MSTLQCTQCKVDVPPDALRCIGCNSLLSRLHLGTVIAGRFRVLELLDTQHETLSWSVEIDGGPSTARLIEAFPSRPLTSSILFHRVIPLADLLLSGRLIGFHPIIDYFTDKGCFYILEDYWPLRSLKEYSGTPGGIKKCIDVYRSVLSFLFTAAKANPPMLHGGISPDTIRFPDQGALPVLCGARGLIAAACHDRAISAFDVLAADLPATALSLLAVLSGNSPERLAGDIDARTEALLRPQHRLAILALLDWLSAPGARLPSSNEEIVPFEADVRSALEAWNAAKLGEALTFIEKARAASCPGSLVLQDWHTSVTQQLSEKKKEKGGKKTEDEEEKRVRTGATPESKEQTSRRSQAPSASVAESTQVAASIPQLSAQSAASPAPVIHQETPLPSPVTDQAPLKSSVPGGRKRWLALPVAAAALWAVVSYIGNGELRSFRSAFEAGRLVEPEGSSAYDLYLKAKRDNGGKLDGKAREMAEEALPTLTKISDAVFLGWYSNSKLPDRSWNQIERIEAWRSDIDKNPLVAARYAYARGQTLFGEQKYADALMQFQEASRYQRNWDLALSAIARSYFREKNVAQAEQYYLEAVKVSPAWVFPRQNLAELYLGQSHGSDNYLVRAEEQARAATRNDPSRPGAHEVLGRVLVYARKYDGACTELSEAVRLASNQIPPPFDVKKIDQMRTRACSKVQR